MTFKVTEKLDVEPARYVVRDEVVDRGVLGDELLVQALVDHYQDAVPWESMERMERKARQEDVSLAANTRAASCGRVIDLFDPLVRHIFKKCMASEYVAPRRG